MSNQRETTLTNELVNILRNMRHSWAVEVAVAPFTEAGKELDAFVSEHGRERKERDPFSGVVPCIDRHECAMILSKTYL